MKKKIQNIIRALALCLLCKLSLSTTFAQGTAFTYQGQLDENGSPANGTNYGLHFYLYNAPTNGTLFGVVNLYPVTVSNGLFTVTLDFGNVFDGTSRWLGVTVQQGLFGEPTTLAPRQQLTATPYAIMANSASNLLGNLPVAQLSGTIPLAQLPAGLLTNNESGVNITGTFSGDGFGVTNISIDSLAGATVNFPIVAWGNDQDGQTNIPSGLGNVMGVAAGGYHSLALKSDGLVAAWGFNGEGETTVPSGLSNVVAVAAGAYHSLALKSDGTVVAWGSPGDGQTTVPSGLSNVMAVAAGGYHSLALKSDGTVIAWGYNYDGETNVPSGLSNVVAVAGGVYNSLALKSDGTVIAWGYNNDGQATVPAGLSNVVAVAAGGYHCLALKSDGTVVAWGYNNDGQAIVPAGLSNVVAVAAGDYHSLALESDGTVVAWGYNGYGETTVPAGLNRVTALATGSSAEHVLAIQQQIVSPVALVNSDNTFNGNVQVSGILSGNGSGLTNLNLNAANLTGTIADARLSANVALRAGGNVFGGNQIVANGYLGIGTATPTAALHVVDDSFPQARIVAGSNALYGSFLSLNARSLAGGKDYYIFSTGASAGEGQGKLVFLNNTDGEYMMTFSTNGCVGIGATLNPTSPLMVQNARCDGNTWINASDRNLKQDFAAISPQAVLEKVAQLPVQTWRYKSQLGQQHLGPVAQDFRAAFGLGADETTIATVDECGVALAAIQGLNAKVAAQLKAKDGEIQNLRQQNGLLSDRLNELAAAVKSLAEKN